MTTVSVQPMKSEPNEREEFYKACSELVIPTMKDTFKMFQHQQKRIDTLTEVSSTLAKQDAETIDTLQAKLNVAVNALVEVENICIHVEPRNVATEALAEIKKGE